MTSVIRPRSARLRPWGAALALALCAAASGSDWPADEETLEGFFDRVFDEAMARGRAPGAVCVVVDRDGIVFAKGYGVTDVETKRPVDPERTLFRVASISKLVTATCVMQLYEQGRLDLDADVNDYLEAFQLADTFPEPVTLAHLLTHTGGFDDRFVGMAAPTRAARGPLGDYLARRMPPRVMPPGRTASYSNHGMALAGHIVETVSGMPFEDYARVHVFKPLGMEDSAFVLEPRLAAQLATGYDTRGGPLRPEPYGFPQTVPASTLMVTGTDMARFLIAHLRLGAYGGARILDTATAEAMQPQQFTHHPDLPGRTFGFVERFENGLRILQHDGLIWGFKSRVLLVPEKGLGLFVSCSGQSSGLPAVATSRFLDRFFPYEAEPADIQARPGFGDRLRDYAGFYRHNRYVRSTFMKFAIVAPQFVPEVRVVAGPSPGMITLEWMTVPARRWNLAEMEPGFFRRVTRRRADDGLVGRVCQTRPSGASHDRRADDGGGEWRLADQGRVAFGRDESGHVTHLFMDTSAYDRIPWYSSRPVTLGAAVVSLAWIILTCIGRLLAAAVRCLRGRESHAGWPASARRLAGFVCGLATAFAGGFGLFLLTLDPHTVGYGPPPMLVALLVLPVSSAVFTLPLPLLAAAAWRQGWWGMWGRVHFTLTTVAAVVFLVVLNYWNFLGFRFG